MKLEQVMTEFNKIITKNKLSAREVLALGHELTTSAQMALTIAALTQIQVPTENPVLKKRPATTIKKE